MDNIKKIFTDSVNVGRSNFIETIIAEFKEFGYECKYLTSDSEESTLSITPAVKDEYYFLINEWIPIKIDNDSIRFDFKKKDDEFLYHKTLLHIFNRFEDFHDFVENHQELFSKKLKKSNEIGVFEKIKKFNEF